MRLIDKGKTYQILTTFKKPLGEQTNQDELPPQPIRRHSAKRRSKKRIRTPPETEEENSARYPTRTSKSTHSEDERPIRRISSLKSPIRQDESMHEEDEETKRTPRIYTEDIEVK